MLGFIGIGAAGSNVIEAISLNNFRCMTINTSQVDSDVVRVATKIIVGEEDGAAKDRGVAKAELKKYYKEIVKSIMSKFANSDEKIIYLVFSAGGGTGSGMGPLLVELIRKFMPDKHVGAITILPSKNESLISQYNALECLTELFKLDIPMILVDNNRLSITNKSRKKFYDTINQQIANDINEFFITRKNTRYGCVDNKEVFKLFSTPGIITISSSVLDGDNKELNITNEILSSLDNNIYVPMDIESKIIKRIAILYEIHSSVTKFVDNEVLYKEVGTPIELFEGFYSPEKEENKQYIVTLFSGTNFPTYRLEEMKEIIEESKKQADKSFENTITIDDVSWVKDSRKKQAAVFNIEKEQSTIDDDVEDLFGKY